MKLGVAVTFQLQVLIGCTFRSSYLSIYYLLSVCLSVCLSIHPSSIYLLSIFYLSIYPSYIFLTGKKPQILQFSLEMETNFICILMWIYTINDSWICKIQDSAQLLIISEKNLHTFGKYNERDLFLLFPKMFLDFLV